MIITLVALILFIGFGAVALLGNVYVGSFLMKQLSAESNDDSFAHSRRNKWRWS